MEVVELFAVFISVTAVFIGMPWAVFTGIAKVRAARAGEGTEMRASELRALVEGAVAEATAPLVARIGTLEAIATDDEPRAPLADALDALPDADDLAEPAAVGRRARA